MEEEENQEEEKRRAVEETAKRQERQRGKGTEATGDGRTKKKEKPGDKKQGKEVEEGVHTARDSPRRAGEYDRDWGNKEKDGKDKKKSSGWGRTPQVEDESRALRADTAKETEEEEENEVEHTAHANPVESREEQNENGQVEDPLMSKKTYNTP